MSMIKNFRLALAAGAIGLIGSFGGAQAQVTESFDTQVIVLENLTITEDTAMDFGSVTLTFDSTNAPTATLGADGTFANASSGSSAMESGGGTPSAGTYTVNGSTSSDIKITFPSSATLTDSTDNFTLSTFVLGSLTSGSFDTTNTADLSACNTAISSGGDCYFTTDSSTGDVTFPMGATIAAATSGTYAAGTYTGSFDLTVEYD